MINKFPENLKKLRKRFNITQNKLAESLNVSKGTISMWESGKREPNIDFIIGLANFFKISIDELISDNARFAFELSEEQQKCISMITKTNNSISENTKSYLSGIVDTYLFLTQK